MKTRSSTDVEHQAFRALWASTLIATLFTTPDGHVLAASPSACRLLGRTEEDLRRIGWKALVDFADKRILSLIERRTKKGYAEGELTYVRSDGTRFPAILSSFGFETADGVRNCSLIRDVSRFRQAEKRARVFSRELLSAREEEKRQLSALLHHEVGSVSVGLECRFRSAEEDVRDGKNRQALQTIRECRRMLAQASKRLRAFAVGLRPPGLDLLGLTAALRQHVRELSRVSGLRMAFIDDTRGAKISPEAQTILFRAAQESLTNVIKHAEAKWARVRLTATPQRIRLTVADGGKGFDPKRLAGKSGRHLGLETMQEMAASLGGELLIQSAKGRGTTIRVDLPRQEPRA